VEGLQFTIRHLLMATAVVAIVLGIGQGVRAFADGQGEEGFFMAARLDLFVAILSPCLIVVDLVTLWAALGIGRPTSRLAVVVPMAFVLGTIPMYYLGEKGWSSLIIWSAIMGLQAIIIAASLLVVRSCGWRLVLCPTTISTRPSVSPRQNSTSTSPKSSLAHQEAGLSP
jgi:hypothetical protein